MGYVMVLQGFFKGKLCLFKEGKKEERDGGKE